MRDSDVKTNSVAREEAVWHGMADAWAARPSRAPGPLASLVAGPEACRRDPLGRTSQARVGEPLSSNLVRPNYSRPALPVWSGPTNMPPIGHGEYK